MKKSKPLYCNLGCGTNIVPSTEDIEWINVDNYLAPQEKTNFIQANICDLPIEKDSVDYILADQVFEHLPMKDIPAALHEIRRILKVGGKANIIVPDFRSAVEDWLKIDHDKYFQPFFYHYLSEVIYGNQNHEGEFHKTPMSAGFLHYALNMVGLPLHSMTVHLTHSPVIRVPGTPEYPANTYHRNAQLIAEITKI